MTLSACEQLLKDSMGLDVASIGSSAVERAVRDRQRACQLPDVQAYWEHLRQSQTELQELIDAVVVPETWFFRDRESFAALARVVRDELLPASGGAPLRLLSVPCASGEEPYSIVMTLLDAGLQADRWRVEAVDICERLLIHARRGRYGKGAFRGNDVSFRDRYFEETESGHMLADSVRQQVRFQQGNLLSPGFLPGMARYDVIFCRNVLIYFDRPTQARAISVLGRLLTPKGLLFVGPSESGVALEHGLRSAKLPLAFAFRKAEVTATPFETLVRRERRPAARPTRSVSAPLQSAALRPAASRPAPPRQTLPPPIAPPALDDVHALADRGRFDEAAERCEAHMRQHGPSAEACFLLGVVREAGGRAADAEAWYRKALYLDQHHEQALLHLALLLERQQRSAEAKVMRRRLTRLAEILKAAGPNRGARD